MDIETENRKHTLEQLKDKNIKHYLYDKWIVIDDNSNDKRSQITNICDYVWFKKFNVVHFRFINNYPMPRNLIIDDVEHISITGVSEIPNTVVFKNKSMSLDDKKIKTIDNSIIITKINDIFFCEKVILKFADKYKNEKIITKYSYKHLRNEKELLKLLTPHYYFNDSQTGTTNSDNYDNIILPKNFLSMSSWI